MRQVQRLQKIHGPSTPARIVELRGTCDGQLRFGDAREPIIEKIRHHEQRAGARECRRPGQPHGVELVKRVDLHELDAGLFENLFARHSFERLLHHSVVTRVSIMARIFDQAAVRREQREIHAPGVDCDAVQLKMPVASRQRQRMLHFVPEPQRVPIKRRKHGYRRVGKTMQFFECETPGFK